MRKLIIILSIFWFSLTCKHLEKDVTAPKAHPVDRKLMGQGHPFVHSMDLDANRMKSSMRFRRERAWDIVQNLLTEVPIGTHLDDFNPVSRQMPLWQTWYETAEFQWMFDDLYNRLGKDGRIKFKGDKALLVNGLPDGFDFCPGDIQDIFARQGDLDISRQFNAERFKERLRKFKTAEETRGVSGAGLTMFSPGLLFHYLQNYRRIFQCEEKLETLASHETFVPARSPCFSTAFPKGDKSLFAGHDARLKANCPASVDNSARTIGAAVAIKSAWQLSDPNATIANFDSSAAGLEKALDSGEWQPSGQTRSSSLSSDKIYTIETVPKLDSGLKERLQLTALHFTTKDLDDWLWISLWWSPEPDSDFGADRPSTGAFSEGSPWRNYKMCVVSAYDEGSPDPAAEFSDASLSQAVGAVFAKTGPHTWCSNPFIERGKGNSRTNCIGCHQHAGSPVIPDDVFKDSTKFVNGGRSLMRVNFPADYLWSFASAPDFFQHEIIGAINDFKDEDAQE